eukprot:Clim_evm29s195 gene=Clim_evmTU29s195
MIRIRALVGGHRTRKAVPAVFGHRIRSLSSSNSQPVTLHGKATNEDLKSFVLIEEFISPDEEDAIMAAMRMKFLKMKYETNHWDNAISKYREFETQGLENCPEWDAVVARVRAVPELKTSLRTPFKSLVHVLDLAKGGFIRPHLDSVKFSGGHICGICLLATRTMVLTPHMGHRDQSEAVKNLPIDSAISVTLPRRSFYVLRGPLRWQWQHSISDPEIFGGDVFPLDRRVSIVMRDEPWPPEDHRE